MRRSAAPSQKFLVKNSSSINQNIINSQSNSENRFLQNSNAVRNVSDVLKILQGNSSNSIDVDEEKQIENVRENDKECVCYNICWARKSTKKHKVWEGDGFMTVANNVVTVKDEDGKFIGQQQVKSCDFEYGQVLSVGGKDVQVLDIVEKQCKLDRKEGTTSQTLFANAVKEAERKSSILLNVSTTHCNEETVNLPQASINNKERHFNICWARKSAKKHKIWEGDGTMILSNDGATFKDSSGHFLGRITKDLNFEEGQILSLGGKEVQIVEEVNVAEKSSEEVKKSDLPLEIIKSDKKNEENQIRKPSDILAILKSSCKENLSENEQEHSEIQTLSKDRRFSICWAKKSTKKHKVWEGDGILVVRNDVATFKDTSGHVLGQLTKILDFTEGQILSLGGKEVQIVEELDGAENPSSSPPRKKHKKNSISSSSYSGTMYQLSSSVGLTRKSLNGITYKRIMLPAPSSEHQWKFNVEKLPLTDVYVDPIVSNVLRPHQVDGIVFLYKCLMGDWDVNCAGAILADEMGLGKFYSITLLNL